MLLQPYISRLLFEYDCVIIPDFGGFVANYAAAKIHPTQHTFEPPFKKIAFNKNLTNNDGLLANSIAKELGISFSEANKKIEEEVLRIEIRLSKKENIEIRDVGTLYFDVERNLQFNPANSLNFLVDSFGLSTFQSPAIKRENFSERFEKQFKDRPALPLPATKKSNRKLWPIALTLSFILAVLIVPLKTNLIAKLKANYSSFNPFFNSEKSKYAERSEAFIFELPAEKTVVSLLANSTEPILNIALTADNSKTIPVKMNQIIEESSTVNIESESPAKEQTIIHSASYYLIAGCFKEKINADTYVTELKAKGYNAVLVGQNASGLYRVSYHTFTDKISAEAAKAELKKENPGVWLFQN